MQQPSQNYPPAMRSWPGLVSKILLPLSVVCVLAGCTEDRAVALKAAADEFSNKAAEAIDSVVELHIRASVGQAVSDEVLVKKAQKALLDTQKNKPDKLDAVIASTAFEGIDERENLRRKAYPQYDNLKLVYREFSGAYQRLPEGSLLATKDVSCSAQLAARLVKYMADAGKELAATPVPLIYETVASKLELKTQAAAAAKSNIEAPLNEAVRTHVAVLRSQAKANQEAVAKLADAADAGMKTLELIQAYDKVSTADVLKGLRQILSIRESSFGLSSKAQIQRLDNIVEKLNSKPALKAAIDAPLNTKPADCQ